MNEFEVIEEHFIAHLQNIQEMSAESAEALRSLIKIHSYSNKTTLQEVESRCQTLYFIYNGAARIFYYKDDKDITEYFALSNSFIIRAESLFTGNSTSKGIEIVLPSIVISISSHPFFQLFEQHSDLERLFNALIRNSYLETLHRLGQIQFHNARERYLGLLNSSAEIVQNIPLKYIASYLGISQVSLSRIRSDLK